MNIYETEQWHSKVLELLRQLRIYEAIEFMSKLAVERFQPAIEEARFTYNNILAYTGKGINDPMSDEIFNRLIVSLYELGDLMKLHFLTGSGSKLAAIKADLDKQATKEHEDLSENLLGLSFDNELQDILRSASLFDDESESETARNHRHAISRVFFNLWLTDKFSENDEQIMGRIFHSSSIPWFEKSMMVSALTLGTIRIFDERRISVLIDLYNHPDVQISQRALFGILISIFLYDKRLKYYHNISAKLHSLKDNPSFIEDILGVLIQFYRSKDSERISRKLKDEIFPQVAKLNEDLYEKLDFEKLLESGDPLDKNPDWEKFFDSQPGLVRKLEELTEMQMEGVDVLLNAFAMLKSFPFFNEVPNWFIPFYPENYAVQEALSQEDKAFSSALLKSLDLSMYMCNSDKFSFVLNMRHMPENQKKIIIQMFEGESEQLEELKAEELSDPALRKKRITIQYMQDLFRFFKLHSLKNEIGDIFLKRFEVHESSVLSGLIDNLEFYKSVANFFFDINDFESANKVFDYMLDNGGNYAELYEKAGYCKQMGGYYTEAISLYQRADLFDTNHKWLLQKIAQCHLAIGEVESALDCYLELQQIDPDNLRINASIGTCYLNMEKPEQALEYFYRVEFADPTSPSGMRPVAWCLFLLNRKEEANKYYDQLLEMEPNSSDLINAGHLAFSMHNTEKALKLYTESIRTRSDGIKSFIKSYNKDRKHLIANDVSPADIALMLDYLRFWKKDSINI